MKIRSLAVCRSCSQSVSPQAAVCPHCGEPTPAEVLKTGKLAGVTIEQIAASFLVLVVGGGVIWWIVR